jgi:hypothetical protein
MHFVHPPRFCVPRSLFRALRFHTILGVPPELDGIKPPIAIPGTVRNAHSIATIRR